jgi:hypothetical protein
MFIAMGYRQTMSLVAGIIITMSCGCATTQMGSVVTAAPRHAAPISHITVLWSEAVLRQDNVPVAQGVAGKVYLFTESSTAITAPGKFTIYAYDETGAAADPEKASHVKPDFTWELLESDLQKLTKKDGIGWSYSLWLPCGPPSATERRYSFRVCFTPEKQQPLLSESTLVTLPGLHGAPNAALARSN